LAVTGDNAASLFLLETLIESYASHDESVIDLPRARGTPRPPGDDFAAEAQGRTFEPRLGDQRVRDLFNGLCGVSELLLGRASDHIDDRKTEALRIDRHRYSQSRCLKQFEKIGETVE